MIEQQQEQSEAAHHELAEFENIDPNQVPPAVANVLLSRARQLMRPNEGVHSVDDFEVIGRTQLNGTEPMFFAFDEKTNKGISEELIYLVDSDADGNPHGVTELVLREDEREVFKNKPFVSWTKTYPQYRRQGSGSRRLQVMNDVSMRAFGLPLYSDPLITDEAVLTWQSLVDRGVARQFTDEQHKRFVFNTN